MPDIEFISVEDVIRLHALVMDIDEVRARANVRDIGLLESAVHRPKQLHNYEGADLPALAATLLWGLVKNHPFLDGNKRTAWLATDMFVHLNGFSLPSGPNSARLVIGIAEGRRGNEQVDLWIRNCLEPLDG